MVSSSSTRRMPLAKIPVWDWSHYYDTNVDERLYEEYRQFSTIKHKDLAPYAVLPQARGLR